MTGTSSSSTARTTRASSIRSQASAPGQHQVGVTPNLTPQVQCNFVGPPAIPSLGPPILPGGANGNVNQAFFEWFGIPVVMPYYGNAYQNLFDMPGVTVRFSPYGSGALPAASNRYQVY